jgi:hypothetical protein
MWLVEIEVGNYAVDGMVWLVFDADEGEIFPLHQPAFPPLQLRFSPYSPPPPEPIQLFFARQFLILNFSSF